MRTENQNPMTKKREIFLKSLFESAMKRAVAGSALSHNTVLSVSNEGEVRTNAPRTDKPSKKNKSRRPSGLTILLHTKL
jgi:hypothetical protein